MNKAVTPVVCGGAVAVITDDSQHERRETALYSPPKAFSSEGLNRNVIVGHGSNAKNILHVRKEILFIPHLFKMPFVCPTAYAFILFLL